MRPPEVPRRLAARAELVEHVQRLAIEHGDVRVAVVGGIEELLLRVGRERKARNRSRRRTRAIDEHLRYVLALRREHLDAAVRSIGGLERGVLRERDGV